MTIIAALLALSTLLTAYVALIWHARAIVAERALAERALARRWAQLEAADKLRKMAYHD
jgi:hypothetical protein